MSAEALQAFQLYSLDHPQVARTLRGKLLARKVELVGQMAAGNAQDFADYKQRVGVIRGIDEALAICEEIEKEERS
jgi:hypothetical protein